MTSRRQGRGTTGPAALGLLPLLSLAAGVVLVAVAVFLQVPDPPRPASVTNATSLTGTPASSTPAAQETGAGPRSAEGGPGPPQDEDGTPRAGEAAPDASTADVPDATAPTAAAAGGTDAPVTTAPLAAAEPLAVRVPAIGVASPLHPLGLAADGTLEVPTGDLVDQAAWYSGSPTPGEAGPSVIEGHVTGPGGRPSVFFELAALEPGDRVEVDRADGGTVVFEVYRVDSFPKDDFPTVAVYGPTTGPELRLITCGGEFDDTTGHHVDNTVVFARAVEAGS